MDSAVNASPRTLYNYARNFDIGEIIHIDYIMHRITVRIPLGGHGSLSDLEVSTAIDLGTRDAPKVVQGQKALIARDFPDGRFTVIEIDPKIAQPITQLSDLVECASLIAGLHEIKDIWWRGQARVQDSQVTWTLIPKVYRKGRPRRYEISTISHFMNKARSRHSNCPPDNDITNWLFLAQHYGLPTRLLDWTESSLIALYFAVKDELQEKDGSEPDGTLWALNPYALNYSQIESPIVVGATEGSPAAPLFGASNNEKIPQQDKILAVSTREMDIRMLVQYSHFTIHSLSQPLEQRQDNKSFLHKLTIPGTAKETLRFELEVMGIKLSSLFPDLDHLAKELEDGEY